MNRYQKRRLVMEGCQIVMEHLDEPEIVRIMATRFRYSEEYYIRIFKEVMGVTPTKYIRLRKVEQAKMWLRHSDLSITEIANKLGYVYPSHFSRMFQNEVSISPIEFRHSIIE
jgi:AraC-like DNA-binding protein